MSVKYAFLFTSIPGAQTKIVEADSPRAAVEQFGEPVTFIPYLNGFMGQLSDGRRFRCRPAPNPKYFAPKEVTKIRKHWSR